MTIFVLWLRAFLFTQLIEVPIYMGLERTTLPRAFGASTLTHPLVWLAFLNVPFPNETTALVCLESFAFITEGLYFALLERHRPLDGKPQWRPLRHLGIALFANATSVVIAEITRALWGIP